MKANSLKLSLFAFALAVSILLFAVQTQAKSKVEAALRDTIAAGGSGRYLVFMTEQADLSAAYAMVDWETRGRYVYDALRNTAHNSQKELINYLANQAQQGSVTEYHSFFIVNAILVDSDLETFDSIASRSDVAAIYAAKDYAIPAPIVLPDLDSPAAVEWGVAKIRADEVWADLGATGQGIVVANIDTGVEYTHSALNAQYRGTATGSHDFNFYDPSNSCGGTVCDNNNHGTHTMGTMVGDDGGANQIGVAPGATWIAAKGCESFSCSSFALLSSAEWMLAPCEFGQVPGHPGCDPAKRPHIINNSWGGGGGDPWYQASVDAWEASGILATFSAGGSGPGSGTIGSPADYCNVIANGATDINDVIASFSSRGPGNFPECTDKPDVSAPGVNVRSSVTGNSYLIFSGTSMASPHTAGCLALLMSIDPTLTYTELHDLLTTTAVDLGNAGFDFDYGYGRIDCYEAALAITEQDIAISFKIQSRYNPPARPGFYQAKVRVIDPNIPAPIPGATVDVTLTLPDGTVMKSAVTTGTGWAFFNQPTAGGGDCTITIDNITAPGYTFDPNQGVTTQTIPCNMLNSGSEWIETS